MRAICPLWLLVFTFTWCNWTKTKKTRYLTFLIWIYCGSLEYRELAVDRPPLSNVVQISIRSWYWSLSLDLYQFGNHVRSTGQAVLKHGVYWCIYACIWRMVVCCESSTYQVYHGVVSVPIYQSNDIVGSLITIVSYVITKQQPLQGYLVRLN